MGDQAFPLPKIVDFIRSSGWDDCQDFTEENIKKGNVNAISKVYHNFLMELGFSRDLLITDMAQFGVLTELEHPELHSDLMPQLTLAAALSYFFKMIKYEGLKFGLRDLSHPLPTRTAIFFSALQNFYCFMNFTNQENGEIEEEVATSGKRQQDLSNAISNFQEEEVKMKQEAYITKAEDGVFQEKLAQSDAQLETIRKQFEEVSKENKELQQARDKLNEAYAQKKARVEDLEKNIRFQDVQQELDDMETQLKNQFNQLEVEKFQFKNGLEEVKDIMVEYSSILEQLSCIREEDERVRDSRHKLQEGVVEQQRLMREEEEENTSIRDLEIRINTVKTSVDSLKLKWQRRKEGKEQESGELKEFVDNLSKSVSSQKMSRIQEGRSLDSHLQAAIKEKRDQENQVRVSYSRLLESLEKFNEFLTAEFQTLGSTVSRQI